MDFREFINKSLQDKSEYVAESTEDKKSAVDNVNNVDIARDTELYNTLNPDTGFRYDIPMLSTADPEYYFKYIYYMKMLKSSPDTFKKILNWD